VTPSGRHRAKTGLCTGSNRFVPVRVSVNPHRIFPNCEFGGLPDSIGALGIAVTSPTPAVRHKCQKNGLSGKYTKLQ
jgi:hypothetical protein